MTAPFTVQCLTDPTDDQLDDIAARIKDWVAIGDYTWMPATLVISGVVVDVKPNPPARVEAQP